MVIKVVLTYGPKPVSMRFPKGPSIENVIQGHLSDRALEAYSVDKLPEARLAVVEEHLLVCGLCRTRLEGIEPVNYIHDTEDGPVYARITRLATGRLMARHWGHDLHTGRAFGSFYAAKQYLSESFSQMYPDHTCQGACGSLQVRDEPDSQDCPLLTGNSAVAGTHGLHDRCSSCSRILRDLARVEREVPPSGA